MKSLFTSLMAASLLAFAVGCGKDNKSGSSNSYRSLYNAGLSVSAQQVLQKNVNWFNGNVEGYPQYGQVTITKTQKVYNTAPNCEQKTFLGIPYQLCTYGGSPTTTVLSQVPSMIVMDGKRIRDKGNADLNAVFASGGTLLNAVDLGPSASQLQFLLSDRITVVTYIIDRGLHSSLNPVLKSTSSNSVRTDIIKSAN